MRTPVLPLFLLVALTLASPSHAASWQYSRTGNSNDIQTHPTAGTAMMGGGDDLDEAFRWLCAKGNGGDFLVLRATGDDQYNAYVSGLCQTNSVATLIIPDRAAAEDPAVAEIIEKAEVLFISGGDQANYIRNWESTPVQKAINAHLAAGKPIGGTSAGLAVQGEFAYGALGDKPDDADLASAQVLPNPYFERVTLVHGFLKIPHLENLLTDSHFAKRDRMGRTLGFLARIMQDGWSQSPREVAVDEKSAVLVEADGKGTVVGSGKGAYFLRPKHKPDVCEKDQPLTFRKVQVYKAPAGAHFDLARWKGSGGTSYFLSVESGRIESTQDGGGVY
jgi:cyanophycinase-like exopeptidase